MFGSALAATSGTIRPGPCGAPACQGGIGLKRVEKPPPVPSPFVLPGLLFQTVSGFAALKLCGRFVPPQPITCGAEAGRSTLAGLGPPSLESLSPEAANTTMPAAVAAAAACSMSLPACAPHLASSAPQEIEHTSQPSARRGAHRGRDVLRPVDADRGGLAGRHVVGGAGDLDVERDLAIGAVRTGVGRVLSPVDRNVGDIRNRLADRRRRTGPCRTAPSRRRVRRWR